MTTPLGNFSQAKHMMIIENSLGDKLANMEDAYVNADRLRTEYQLQLEELQHAVRGYRDARGRYHTQKACEELLAVLQRQETASLENAIVEARGK